MNTLEKLGYTQDPDNKNKYTKNSINNESYNIFINPTGAKKLHYHLGGPYGCSGVEDPVDLTIEEMEAVLEVIR